MPSSLPVLNLPACALHIEGEPGSAQVFDPVRRRLVSLSPEEWVRQHMIAYLHKELAYPMHLMAVEHTLRWNTLSRRCDILVYGDGLIPVMIVELKAPGVAISQKTLDQAIRYNQAFKAPYLLLSNGLQHLALMILTGKDGSVTYLGSIPDYETVRKSGQTVSRNQSGST